MAAPYIFLPSRRRGLLLNSGAALLLAGGAAICIDYGLTQPTASRLTLFLLIGLLICLPLAWLLYCIYALLNASYTLEREGLRLRWGLRAEDIPIPEIEWVRPASDLVLPLPLPRLAWIGALTGLVNVPDLGPVEFLASERRTMLLVATPSKIYAISPADPGAFSIAFRHATELGSLAPLRSFSARPAAYISHVWDDRAARILFAAGIALLLFIFVFSGMGINQNVGAALGALPDSKTQVSGPAVQALLLPLMAAAAFGANLVLGLALYRRTETHAIAYLLWAGGAIVPLIFLIGTFFTF